MISNVPIQPLISPKEKLKEEPLRSGKLLSVRMLRLRGS